jgi:hypothetical protein
MRKRKLRWVLAVLLLAVGAFVLWPRPDRVTSEGFGRIAEGMSRSEVEAILGAPGDYTSGPTASVEVQSYGWLNWAPRYGPGGVTMIPGVTEWREPDGTVTCKWEGDAIVIWVAFRSSGEASDAFGIVRDRRVEQSSLDNLLWRAKRQWRKWFPEKP